MLKQKGMFNKLLISLSMLILLLFNAQSQDAQNDVAKNQRTVAASGRWYTGGTNTSFISVGQMGGTSTLLTVTDGQTEYQASFGFLIPLITEKEPNRPPVALSPPISVSLANSNNPETLKPIELNGSDPDNDPIEFVITEKPKKGTLVAIGTSGREFTFKPNSGLIASEGIRDTLKFKVVETEGELESEAAVFPFEFNVNDVAHQITNFNMNNLSDDVKTFDVGFEDDVLNTSYEITLSFFNNGNLVQIAKETFDLDVLNVNGNSLSTSFTVLSSEFPEVFEGNLVAGLLEVKGGDFSEDEFDLFNNVIGSTGGANLEQEILNLGGSLQSSSTGDGKFFTFATRKSTPENSSVELNIYAVEFDSFDLTKAEISVIKGPIVGSSTEPILVKSTANLAQWILTYTTEGEEGYADSLQFAVNNTLREIELTSYAVVDVIDVNDAPELSALADQELDEDNSLIIEPNFSDVDSEVTLSASSSNASNIRVNVANNQIEIVPIADYSGSATISVVVEETDNDEPYSILETFDVTVNPVNDSPVISSINDQTIDEDNTFTYTLETTDVDATVALFNYAVTPSIQGVSTVSTQGNTLFIIPNENFNGEVSYSITADDGLGTNTSISEAQTFKLTINSVNDAPVVTAAIPTQNIVQGFPSYTIDLGEYFEDVETADSDLTFSLGAISALFTTDIVNDVLTLEPISGQQGTEDFVITASDGSLSASQTVTFNLSSLGPDITTGSINNLSLDEDFGLFEVDLTGIFTDVNDGNATFSYTVLGLDNLGTEINNNTLVLSSEQDFNGTESVYVIGTTNGVSAFVNFDVQVNPINDGPTLDSADDQIIQEDFSLNNLFIGFEDIDTDSDNLVFAATSSDESIIQTANISIDKGNAGITLSAAPEDNANGEVTITINVTDDGQLSDEISFDVAVLSINDSPEANSNSLLDATEDSEYQFDVSTLFSDADGDNLSYALEDAPVWLSLTNSLIVGTPTNNNVGSSSFTIIATDPTGASVNNEYALVVINTNDSPTVSNAATDITATEDVLLSSLLSDDVFEDIDGDDLTITASFNGADWLTFDATSQRFTGTPTNDDVGSITISITATDPSGASVSDEVTLTVLNTNDTPTDISITGSSIEENIPSGVIIGALSTTDVDANDSFSYSISESEINDAFLIDGNNLISNQAFNFESNSSISVTIVTVDEAGASYAEVFNITVENINEAPTDLALDNDMIAENLAPGSTVGSLSSTDEDTNDTFTYELVSGEGDTDNDNFDIVSGALTSTSIFNFESASSYSVRIKSTDAGGLTTEKAFNITVSDANDAPTDLSIDNSTIEENEDAGAQVGILSAEDEDSGETFTYSLVPGSGDNNNAEFEIVEDKLNASSSFDFETKNTYSVRVAATDGAGASFEKVLTISITNVAEVSLANINNITFDPTPKGETSQATFSLQNTGDTPIDVTSITLPEAFTTPSQTLTVGVGQTTDVTVTFSPLEAQVYSGVVTIQSNAGETTVSITGEGVQVTSIDDDILDAQEVSLYPNPASEYLQIDFSKAPLIQPTAVIVNLNGKTMWFKSEVKETLLNVNIKSYPVGTYLLRISSEKGSVVKKFMVIR